MTEFPRFGPNGAHAFFSDERDVPPGWQPTAEHAQRMQTLAPPPFAAEAEIIRQNLYDMNTDVLRDLGLRMRKGRRK